MDRKIFKLAQPNISDEAINEVIRVLKSGKLVQGDNVAKFESEICKYLNVENAICVSSGTAALHLSLVALGIGPGDEVIVPAFTFPATANVVELVGADSVLVDVCMDDCCIDVEQIEKKITSKTKAIIPVHEFGQSAEIGKIVEIAQKYNVKVIEDAACAFGTEFNGKKVGTFGELGCFSFHPRKALTTGEGGVIVTHNNELAQKLKSMRNHGIAYNNGKMDFVYAGFNYRMTDFQAILGIYQLKEIENEIAHRQILANEYDKKLSIMSGMVIPKKFIEKRHVYQTYHIILPGKIDRDDIIKKLKEDGIETNYGAQALNCLTFYNLKYGYCENNFPNATNLFGMGLALPMGRHIHISDINEICKQLIKLC